jgi:RNA polymerase sigma-70 factor (ECF subfamily)
VGVKAGLNDGMADAAYRSSARERELIARIADGDRRALEELYGLYHRRMGRFLMRLTRRYELAEEIINDTFWVVWRKAGEFRGESQPSTWIFGIAYRKARNAFRAAARQAAETGLEAAALPAVSDPFGTEELRDWLSQALAQLPPEQALAVQLCYALGHSCEEIAAITNCPVNTVKTRLFHARAKLRAKLPQLAGAAAQEDTGS